MGAKSELKQCLQLLESGAVHPVLDTVYPLEQVSIAQTRLEARDVFGKLAISPEL